MIEVEHLSRRFGSKTVVDDLTFTVKPGEVLGFLGPNGAGKSTTMKMITGFLRPSAGSIRVCGQLVDRSPVTAQRTLGYLPEGAPLYADMTVAEFLDFVAAVRGFEGKERKTRIDAVIDKVHLESVLHQSIETLSKGFKRRVGLAQAILHDPAVLILDEPTDGLDPNQKHEVRALIHGMAKDKVVVLSTHILEEVEAVCTRAIIIGAGRLLADATPAALEARSPRHHSVILVTQNDASPTPAQLGNLPGVASVEFEPTDSGDRCFRLYPLEGRTIIGEVQRAACAGGWRVESLRLEQGRLDEVFRHLTRGGGDDDRRAQA
ncbi:MAG: ATP-binding cassette domain-containing protein [Pseudomonadota bacterium]